MTERPIIFSTPMVQALLAGRKTQTRRLLKPQPHLISSPTGESYIGVDGKGHHIRFAPDDLLWVREAFAFVPPTAYRASTGVESRWNPNDDYEAAVYRAGWERSKPGRWKSSIHMPRWASRLTLLVTEVRVQRLQGISEEDAIAEGMLPQWGPTAAFAFRRTWESLHGPGSWEANPWVAAISFEVARR